MTATPKVRVAGFSVSIEGFGAGPAQGLEHPLGENGMELHGWLFDTQTFRKTHGGEGGATGIDDNFAARGFAKVGAWILGRNMFGPLRGPWPDESWRGWSRHPRIATADQTSRPRSDAFFSHHSRRRPDGGSAA
jgi:dihydrofolate reductase